MEKTVARIERKINNLETVVNTPRQEAVQTVSEQKDTDQQGERTPIRPPANASPNKSREPQKSNNQAVPQGRRIWHVTVQVVKWRHWKQLLEVVGIFFAVGYAVVTYLEWRDLRRNFEAEQRSWLQVGTNLQSFGSNIPDTVTVSEKNIGKSVADGSVGLAAFEVVDKKDAPMFYRNDRLKNHASAGLAFPGTEGSGWTVQNLDDNGNHIPVSDRDKKRLLNGDAYIAVYGELYYRDQFGMHWTRFCDWIAYAPGNYGSKACVAWNAVGNGDPPTQ